MCYTKLCGKTYSTNHTKKEGRNYVAMFIFCGLFASKQGVIRLKCSTTYSLQKYFDMFCFKHKYVEIPCAQIHRQQCNF